MNAMTYFHKHHNHQFSQRIIRMNRYVSDLQSQIVNEIVNLGFEYPHSEEWIYQNGNGGGQSLRFEDHDLIERGGVNVSCVQGQLTPRMFESMRHHHKTLADMHPTDQDIFSATGISLVLHPKNPHVPTVHANFRLFEAEVGASQCWWFGGGADLTPYLLYPADAKHFHQTYYKAMEFNRPGLYQKYKQWCDQYFWLSHRAEARGVGGIFFDDLCTEQGFEEDFSFVRTMGDVFIESYLPIVKRHLLKDFTDAEKKWQDFRHSRYVEFNLLHDRGTKFGLLSQGRTDSILMSMPKVASWSQEPSVAEISRAAELQNVLKLPQNWIT